MVACIEAGARSSVNSSAAFSRCTATPEMMLRQRATSICTPASSMSPTAGMHLNSSSATCKALLLQAGQHLLPDGDHNEGVARSIMKLLGGQVSVADGRKLVEAFAHALIKVSAYVLLRISP